MWYLIFMLLLGQGGHPNNQGNNNTQTMQTATEEYSSLGDNGGDLSTPIPPRPPKR